MKYLKNAIILASTLTAMPLFAIDFDPAAMVKAHNRWRMEAGVKEPLVYSAELAAASRLWANTLQQSNQCQMEHSEGEDYGENLFWASATQWSDGRLELQKVTPAMVVDSWGSEKAYYNYADNSCKEGEMCGHYTQVVWRDTQQVGCAVAVCENTRQQVWVCQYLPAGNWEGKKPY